MKKLAALLLLCFSGSLLYAQQDSSYVDAPVQEANEKKFDPSRLVFGGNIGATFGDYTFIQVSPQVGYAFNQYFTAGAGINFVFSSEKYRDYNGNELYKYEYGYAGLNLFARAFPVRFLMVSAQPEVNYNWGRIKYNLPNTPDQKLDDIFIPSLLLGAGVVIPAGGKGGMMVSIQYDVIQHERSPYGTNAFINFGFTF
ncbi:MAG TPA: hypothetical protein VLC98_07560 [Phnomibacter sp.]|nr:hypothetical protein [Phnomibacter sp.]